MNSVHRRRGNALGGECPDFQMPFDILADAKFLDRACGMRWATRNCSEEESACYRQLVRVSGSVYNVFHGAHSRAHSLLVFSLEAGYIIWYMDIFPEDQKVWKKDLNKAKELAKN